MSLALDPILVLQLSVSVANPRISIDILPLHATTKSLRSNTNLSTSSLRSPANPSLLLHAIPSSFHAIRKETRIGYDDQEPLGPFVSLSSSVYDYVLTRNLWLLSIVKAFYFECYTRSRSIRYPNPIAAMTAAATRPISLLS